jgi:hypothetical protein
MRNIRFGRALVLAIPFVAAGAFSRPAQAQTGLQYFAVTPCRAVDTRSSTPPIVQASIFRGFTIKGLCGIPASAKAVSLNLTIVGPSADGFFSLWPFGGPFPVVATINFVAGEPAIANGAIVPLAVGTPDLYGGYGTALGLGTTHAVMDVTGYFQ